VEQIRDVIDTVEQIRPLLAGKGPAVQSAVLGELTATWLLGHRHVDGELATQELRNRLLEGLLALIRTLVDLG
jgi:hypothetical protein